jgi:hypothetical protein
VDFDKAKEVIRNGCASWTEQCLAVSVIAGSEQSTLDDLIACLLLGGVCAEIAATQLHVRTKRPPCDGKMKCVVDVNDWLAYLGKS